MRCPGRERAPKPLALKATSATLTTLTTLGQMSAPLAAEQMPAKPGEGSEPAPGGCGSAKAPKMEHRHELGSPCKPSDSNGDRPGQDDRCHMAIRVDPRGLLDVTTALGSFDFKSCRSGLCCAVAATALACNRLGAKSSPSSVISRWCHPAALPFIMPGVELPMPSGVCSRSFHSLAASCRSLWT